MTILYLYIINIFAIIGFYNAANYVILHPSGKIEKGGLYFVKKYGDKIFNEFWRKPFYDCLGCMASIHSVLPYWLFMWQTNCINYYSLIFYPFYILSLSGILVIIDAIWDKITE